jgi:hypothetical protein
MAKRNERTIEGPYSRPNTEVRRDPRVDDIGMPKNWKPQRIPVDEPQENGGLSAPMPKR